MLSYPFFAGSEYLVVLFDADAPAVCIEGCNGGCHASCGIVENKFSLVGVGFNEPFYERNGFLSGMDLWVRTFDSDNGAWVFFIGYDVFCFSKISITSICLFLVLLAS